MSWWTKNRKKVGIGAGLLGAMMIPGAQGAIGGLLSGLMGGGEAAAAAGAGGALAEGAGAAAAMTPEAMAASKAAADSLIAQGGAGGELAFAGMNGGPLGGAAPVNAQIAHNTAFDALRFAKSPGEAVGNLGSWFKDGLQSPMQQGLGGMAKRGMGLLGDISSGSSPMGMLGGGQPPQAGPPMPPQPQQPQQPMPQFGGYQSGMPQELAGLPPNDPRVLAWMRQRGMA